MKTSPVLRRINAVLSALLLLMFIAHGIAGVLLMGGMLETPVKGLDHALEALCWVHIAIGVYLSVQSLRAIRKSGASYPAQNKRFWAVRISGIAIGVCMLMHMIGFNHFHAGEGFGPAMLAINLALVVAIAVHVVCNVRPQLMSLGITLKEASPLQFALIGLLALMLVAFVLFFLQIGVS